MEESKILYLHTVWNDFIRVWSVFCPSVRTFLTAKDIDKSSVPLQNCTISEIFMWESEKQHLAISLIKMVIKCFKTTIESGHGYKKT